MTGYGRASGSFGDKTITVEVRALNSKMTDLKLRLPSDYKEKEIELRKIVTDHAERGKIDLLVEIQNVNGAAAVSLNEGLFKGYHAALTRLCNELNIQQSDLLSAILRIPNVVATSVSDVDEDEWNVVSSVVVRALDTFKSFRRQEGHALEADLRVRVANILLLLSDLGPYETERFSRM